MHRKSWMLNPTAGNTIVNFDDFDSFDNNDFDGRDFDEAINSVSGGSRCAGPGANDIYGDFE